MNPRHFNKWLPVIILAERAGFEPAVHLWGHTHDFQSCSFSRSDISPLILCYVITARRIVAFAGVLAGEKSFFGGSSNKIPRYDKSIFKKHLFLAERGGFARYSSGVGLAPSKPFTAPLFSVRATGGERGIRTPVRAVGPQIDFESIPLRPLRYLSVI